MYHYQSTLRWKEGKVGIVESDGNESFEVASPPEFGGPPHYWSPEQLFVASIGSCIMSTFLFFTERMRISLQAYESTAKGQMEKTPDGLRFTQANVAITAHVQDESEVSKVENLQPKLEKYCPISMALNFPVHLELIVKKTQS